MARKDDRPGRDAREAEGADDPSVPALLLFQERWVLPIAAALLRAPEGGLGFNEIGRRVGGPHPPTLASRLELLERHGLVEKRVLSHMPPRTVYRLSGAGAALRPVLAAIEAWARDHYRPPSALEAKASQRNQKRTPADDTPADDTPDGGATGAKPRRRQA